LAASGGQGCDFHNILLNIIKQTITSHFCFVKMFSPLFSSVPQAGVPQAGGLKEISRWLREAWRATPPDMIADKNSIPEGCQRDGATISGIPPGCGVLSLFSGGVARHASLNHRLISGKPPACFGAPSRHQTNPKSHLDKDDASAYSGMPFLGARASLPAKCHAPAYCISKIHRGQRCPRSQALARNIRY
jgi:hypothetical protein